MIPHGGIILPEGLASHKMNRFMRFRFQNWGCESFKGFRAVLSFEFTSLVNELLSLGFRVRLSRVGFRYDLRLAICWCTTRCIMSDAHDAFLGFDVHQPSGLRFDTVDDACRCSEHLLERIRSWFISEGRTCAERYLDRDMYLEGNFIGASGFKEGEFLLGSIPVRAERKVAKAASQQVCCGESAVADNGGKDLVYFSISKLVKAPEDLVASIAIRIWARCLKKWPESIGNFRVFAIQVLGCASCVVAKRELCVFGARASTKFDGSIEHSMVESGSHTIYSIEGNAGENQRRLFDNSGFVRCLAGCRVVLSGNFVGFLIAVGQNPSVKFSNMLICAV